MVQQVISDDGLEAAARRLLAGLPADAPMSDFRGARFEPGLARMHFPDGTRSQQAILERVLREGGILDGPWSEIPR